MVENVTHKILAALPAYVRRDYLVIAIGVFLAYLFSAKLGQYTFFDLHSSPAVIWPPVGVALAAAFLWGPRMWLPIALAQFFASLTSPAMVAPLSILSATFAYTTQALLGAYVLRRLGFVGSMANARDALLLLAVVFVVSTFAPVFTTLVTFLIGNLPASPWINFSRAWAGGVMSALIIVPLITPWSIPLSSRTTRNELIEGVLGLLAVAGATYLVFWTAFPQINVFIAIFLLLATLFWVGLRMRPRVMTFALFLVALLGLLGSIVANPSNTPLNQQLFASELFIVLIAPIFLILTALVTERVRALSQFEYRTNELEEALRKLSAEDKAKTEFIATLAHELRNPLSPVMTTLELLRFSAIPADVVRLVEGAQTQTQNMKRLLDDLLDVARITKRNFDLKKEFLEFSPMLSRALTSAQGYLHSRSHTLSVTLPSKELLLEVDPVRFEQILVNLLNNAAKYTNVGGQINLVCRKDDDTVVISVSDNGVGIEPERLERVFEPFGGLHGSRRPGGLHLGLSLAKRMTELHGGTLTAASAGVGRGSTFTLRLPLSRAIPTRAFVPAQEAGPKVVPAGRERILVVDDNEPAAQGLAKLLQLHGHEVVLAYDGKGALEVAQSFAPDVVLLDIGLPDIDGYEIAKRLLGKPSSPRLVALTGYGQEEDKSRALAAGFSHHLTKPVGIAELQSVIVGLKPVR